MFLGEGNGTPLQYSCLENTKDRGAWCAAVHGVATSWTRLSDFTFTFHFHAMEKEMATHSSVLAWRISGTAEPGRLPFMGSHRVRHDWSNLAAAAVRDEIGGVGSHLFWRLFCALQRSLCFAKILSLGYKMLLKPLKHERNVVRWEEDWDRRETM